MAKCHLMSVLQQQRNVCSPMTEIPAGSAHIHGSLSQ